MLKEHIIVAVISGLLALAGGFSGALLTRRTEYQKWLRQERSAAFAEFFRQLHSVLEKAIPIPCGSEPKQQPNLKVAELFMGLNAQEYIVRLYLSPTDRQSFSDLTKHLWDLHSPSTQLEHRIRGVNETLRKIQSLFETTLHSKTSRGESIHDEGKTP
jgi:hypothetical protein